jgi:predicted secreted Zn-dependent protease
MKAARAIGRIAACCILAGAALSAYAEVTLSESVDRYSIHGAHEVDLRREMSAKGPTASDSRRFDAYTRWNIAWRYSYRQDGGQCRITAVTTEVKIAMTLPEWSDESAAQDRLRKRWREYIAVLTGHENGHRKNGLDAAREIDRGIAALPPQPDCGALGAAANALGNQILRIYNERDLDYDRSTDHGRNQGARFP